MRPHRSTLFPYTTLFRSHEEETMELRPGEITDILKREIREYGREIDVAETGSVDLAPVLADLALQEDRKSTRLNSSHLGISYAVFCLKKKKKKIQIN